MYPRLPIPPSDEGTRGMTDTPSGAVPPADDPPPVARRDGKPGFIRSHPRTVVAAAITIALLIAADAWILSQRRRYEAEIVRLRSAMSDIERQRTDQLVSRERNKLRVALELLKRQARVEPALHLSVTIDSSAMYLERDGLVLREMSVDLGPERRVGMAPDTVHLATPRGVRSLARILTEADSWEIPDWVYADRGIPIPESRTVRGGLGPAALFLDGGTIIYSLPASGPLSDSAYVMPGAIRVRAEDLRALLPNLSAGVRVYFY